MCFSAAGSPVWNNLSCLR